jgi:predicted NBD/HSP70 family sugar kinase
MYVGIDVGGTKIQAASLHKEIVRLTHQVATPSGSYAAFLAALVDSVEEAAGGERVERIGIGLPGTVTERDVTWMPNLPFLNGRQLAIDLAALVQETPIVLANDAQAALLGEVWRGAARACRSAVLVSVGTGVGGAILQEGKVVRGAHGSAGAFGWLTLDWHEPTHPEHGYVERHASGSALDALARQCDPPATSYELIARARANDAGSMEIIARFSNLLAAAFASIASILDPEVLILAGGLSEAFDLFSAPLRRGMSLWGSPGVRETPIVPAQLGKYAAAYGALRLAMQPELLSV